MYRFGVTRRVEIEDKDWVIKRPYSFTEDGDVDWSCPDEENDFYYVNMELDEIDDDGEWYNQREIDVYKIVNKCYDCFAAIREDSTKEELFMERIDGTIDDYEEDFDDTIRHFAETQFQEYKTNIISIRLLLSGVLRYNEYNKTKVTIREIKHFLKQLEELEKSDNEMITDVLTDLHSNNIGFKDGHIKIIDYAGYGF